MGQPYAAANAGRPFGLHSGVLGPAWLRLSFGDEQKQIQRVMKIVTLLLALATTQMGRAGEIEKVYWQQQTTNSGKGSIPFSGPKLPSTSHGITEIGIERTACFGSCPVYVCIISRDGKVRYHGEAHVDKMGDWETKVDPYKFHQLANFIVESGYWQMEDTFATSVTDGDTLYYVFAERPQKGVPKLCQQRSFEIVGATAAH